GNGWLLVAITGTHGEGESSMWRGVVIEQGLEAKVNQEIVRRTQVDKPPSFSSPPEGAQAMKCQRCGQEAFASTMSRFNTEMICLACEQRERQHPDYPKAVAAEEEALKRGDLNFPGIGKPADL